MPNAINDAEKRKDIYLFRGKFIEDMQESASASLGRSPEKKTVKKGDIVPFWRPPPYTGQKGTFVV